MRRDTIRYLLQLRSMGYRGWRYDMVHGFHARWITVYNRASKPTFSVGEYDWDKHYFDWGDGLRSKIKALINARKVAGVKAGSQLHVQVNAREKNVYAARVVGRNGDLYVRVGGSDNDWQPRASNYSGSREYAAGEGWKVWVGLPGDPEVQSAPLKPVLDVPEYRLPETIEVPDEWLN